MIPCDPCGRAMDYLRACYTYTTRPWQNSDLTARIRWYFCEPGYQLYDGRHLFASHIYNSDDVPYTYPGEVEGTKFVFDEGIPPVPDPNGTPCGPARCFTSGGIYGVDPPLARLASGLAGCCTDQIAARGTGGGPSWGGSSTWSVSPTVLGGDLKFTTGGPPAGIEGDLVVLMYDALEQQLLCILNFIITRRNQLRLYQNDHTPDIGDDPSRYTECDFPGYNSQDVTGPITEEQFPGYYRGSAQPVTFTATPPVTPPQTAFGWYLTDPGQTVVFCAFKFVTPFTFTTDGVALTITPVFFEYNTPEP